MHSTAAAPRSPLIQPFYPSLDGLRALAFLLVFLNHYAVMISPSPIWDWTWVGVDLFFVLSGFLITGILYDSLHGPSFFRGFYIRRSLRIFPIFYAFWLAVFLLTPVIHIAWNRYSFALAAYSGNFFIAAGRLGLHPDPSGLAYASHNHPGQLRYIDVAHLWSLCVEEQFYFVWPAVVWLLRSRKTLLRICLALILITPIGRLLYAHAHPSMVAVGELYATTFSRLDTLLVGAALALWLRGPAPSTATLRKLAFATILIAPTLLAVFYRHESFHNALSAYDPIVDTIGFSLIALTAASILLLVLDPAFAPAKILQSRPLVYLGRISYGLYFFHLFFAPIFRANAPRLLAHHLGFAVVLAPFAITTVIASLSFRFLESPFLRLKSRLAPRPGTVSDPSPEPTDSPLSATPQIIPTHPVYNL